MDFNIISDGKNITCNVIFTFKDECNNINYIVYTDGTKDKFGDLEIYASRYVIDNDDIVLKAIENEYEWDLIDNMIESRCGDV